MTPSELEELRYPIGKFKKPEGYNAVLLKSHIADIEQLPAKLRSTLTGLTEQQLDERYRPEGWTIRQVVHHIADSHINSYMRFKLATTEKDPTIKPYEQSDWAELQDARTAPVEISLKLIDALHERWVMFLNSLDETQWKATYFHPESNASVPLWEAVALYSWHSRHHLAHITTLKERMGW